MKTMQWKVAMQEKAVRRGVLGRDGKQCQACHLPVSLTASDPQQRPQAHHIHPRSKGGPYKAKNLVILCGQCHADVHRGRLDIIGTNAMNLRFVRSETP